MSERKDIMEWELPKWTKPVVDEVEKLPEFPELRVTTKAGQPDCVQIALDARVTPDRDGEPYFVASWFAISKRELDAWWLDLKTLVRRRYNEALGNMLQLMKQSGEEFHDKAHSRDKIAEDIGFDKQLQSERTSR